MGIFTMHPHQYNHSSFYKLKFAKNVAVSEDKLTIDKNVVMLEKDVFTLVK